VKGYRGEEYQGEINDLSSEPFPGQDISCFGQYYTLHKKMPLPPTFVFAQWWDFENVFVPRDQTLNEDRNSTKRPPSLQFT
jgi:hypothetical protein